MSAVAAEAIASLGAPVEVIQDTFHRTRQHWIAHDMQVPPRSISHPINQSSPQGWLAAHRFYDAAVTKLRALLADSANSV